VADVLRERILTPLTKPGGFTWGAFSLRAYVDLIRTLIGAQMKVRYKYTFIGLGWAVLNPVLQMFVYAFVFGSIFSADRADFRLFLLAGLLPWQAFSSGLTSSVQSLISSRDLLKKAPFPSEALPIAAVGSALLNFLIVFTVFVVYMAARGFPVLAQFHWVVMALVIQTLFLTGLALLLSPINVYFRDVEQFLGFAVWIWFFLTPIFYPLSRLDPFQAKVLLALNPMAVVVTTMQDALLRGEAPPIEPVLFASALAVAVAGIGWKVFRRFQYDLPKAL
jgi:ABC-type polysaccharide/polyol phosphate export permease